MTTTTYDDLRQRMLDGDTTITSAALDKARRDAEFETVRAEAAHAAECRAAEAHRQQQIRDLNAEAAGLAGAGFAEMQRHYADALNALRGLRHEMTAFNGRVFKIGRASEQLDTVLDTDPPAAFNIEFELDRLEKLARVDREPDPPFSRLYVPTEGTL